MFFFNALRLKSQLLKRADAALDAARPTQDGIAEIARALRNPAVRDALATRILVVSPHTWERVAGFTTTDESTAVALTYAALTHHNPQQRLRLLGLARSEDPNYTLATCFRDALDMGRFDQGFQAMMWAAMTVRRQISPAAPAAA